MEGKGRERGGQARGGEKNEKKKKAKISCLERGEKKAEGRGQRSDVAYVTRGSVRSFGVSGVSSRQCV